MRCRIEFDERRIFALVERADLTALRRAGAYIRKAARNKVATSTKSSAPGTPPNTRRGLLKNSLLFGVEKQRSAVLIGPAASIIGLAMTPHEFGGVYRGRRYPRRPLMVPTLERTAPKLAKFWANTVK